MKTQWYMMELNAWGIASLILLIISLAFIGTGYFFKKNMRHVFLAGGELLFGLFWLTYVPEYINKGDYVNLLFCLAALPFFGYIAYHEYLCFKREEELKPLDWIAGTAFFGATIYFAFAYIRPLHQALVYAVAYKSAAVATLFGYFAEPANPAWRSTFEYAVPLYHNGYGNIQIVLACTGIQAIALFIGFIISTRPDRDLWIDWAKLNRKIVKKKLKTAQGFKRFRLELVKRNLDSLMGRSNWQRVALAILYTIPVIYGTNLLRNAALIYVVYEDKLEFELAHNYLTKIMSLALMLFMLLVIFDVLPELQENFLGLLDTFRYRRKDNVKDGFVELDFGDEES